MATECSAERFEFARVKGRSVVAGFDGGTITADAGALLLGASDRVIGLINRFACCFTDSRLPERIEHTVATLVIVFGAGFAQQLEMRRIIRPPVQEFDIRACSNIRSDNKPKNPATYTMKGTRRWQHNHKA